MDKYYVHKKVCPTTDKTLTYSEVFYTHGVCPRCGHNNYCTITHYKVVVGHWEYKPWWRKVFLNEQDVFIPKER